MEYSNNYLICNNTEKECIDIDFDAFKDCVSIYEVLRMIDGIPLFLEDHLERFKKSAKIIGISLDLDFKKVQSQLMELALLNEVKNGNIKIVYHYKNNLLKASLCYFVPHAYPTETEYQKGVPTISFQAERKNPNAKVVNHSLRESSDTTIKNEGIYEVILIDNQGYITEGSRSNIFFINGDVVLTAPKEDVLLGITRKYAIEACKRKGISVEEKKISCIELEHVNAAFISGTSPKILPINKIDCVHLNTNNSLLRQIMQECNTIVDEYLLKNRISAKM